MRTIRIEFEWDPDKNAKRFVGDTDMLKRMRVERYADAPPEIAAAILSAVEVVDDFPPPVELMRKLKKSVTLRLDRDVYQWFRKPGSGYQTRINMVLRAYMLSRMEETHENLTDRRSTKRNVPSRRTGGARDVAIVKNAVKAMEAMMAPDQVRRARAAAGQEIRAMRHTASNQTKGFRKKRP